MITKISAVIVGAVLPIVASSQASAQDAVFVTVTVGWVGTECIQIESPYSYDRFHSGIEWSCSDIGVVSASYWALPGQLVGSNPYMGDADSVSCSLKLNGHLNYTDAAIAGDGHDANCLRILTQKANLLV